MISTNLKFIPHILAIASVFFVASGDAEETIAFSVPLRQTSPSPADAAAWPFVTGIPIPRGALADAKHVKLVDANGNEVSAEFKALAHWSPSRDSIQWLRVAFLAPTMIVQAPKYQLLFGRGVTSAPVANPIRITQDDMSLSVTTGPLRFILDKKRGGILSSVSRHGRKLYTADGTSGPYVEDDTGAIYRTAFEQRPHIIVEESGPLRAVVRVESWHVRDLSSGTTPFSPAGVRLNKSITRYHAYSGLSCIEVDWTFVVTVDTRLVQCKDIGLRMSGARVARFGLDRDKDIEIADGYLLQKRPDQFVVRQLRGRSYADLAKGTKAPGWFATKNLAITLRDFWQTSPKELEINQSTMIVHAWPGHDEPISETATGTSRTQPLLLDFSGESTERIEARRALFLARPHVWIKDPQWLVDSGVLGPMDVNAAETWEDASLKNWEKLDHAGYYGIWHWGYMPESIRSSESPALSGSPSPGYLNTHWFLYACTGHAAHLRYARANTHHWRDIGIAHYSTPSFEKRIPNGQVRSGTQFTGDSGVFPLLMDYYMTGDRRSLETAELYVSSIARHSDIGASMKSLLDWYAQSWDPELGRKIDGAIQGMIAKDSAAAKWPDLASTETSFLAKYLWLSRQGDASLQHRKDVVAYVKKHADSWLRSAANHNGQPPIPANLLAAAWWETGDAKFVQPFVREMQKTQVPRERWLVLKHPAFGSGAQGAVNLDHVLYAYAAWQNALATIKIPAIQVDPSRTLE